MNAVRLQYVFFLSFFLCVYLETCLSGHQPHPYLSHVGDEEGQPGAEEEPQQDPQSQTGLQCPPPVPVSQAPLAVHRRLVRQSTAVSPRLAHTHRLLGPLGFRVRNFIKHLKRKFIFLMLCMLVFSLISQRHRCLSQTALSLRSNIKWTLKKL